MLMLRSGEQVTVTIKNLDHEGAEISATGPIPDPIEAQDFDDES